MKYILFNELANNGHGKDKIGELTKDFKEGEFELVNVIGLNCKAFQMKLKKEDVIYLVGGDGTLNHFANDFECDNFPCDIYYLSSGTGNDFLNDVQKEGGIIKVNDYLKNLPTVFVKDMERKFINGIGYGIDGYCCEIADRQREKKPGKAINYTSIAIKGLLFFFKRKKATVVVDGKEYSFKKVWLCGSMNGKYYGGGMKVAPNQERLSKEKTLTLCVFTGKTKLGSLMTFPKIFEGKLPDYPKYAHYFVGKEIEVKFNEPCALQIDGETVLAVTEYKVKA